jgi:hypothetical protein
MAEKTATGTRDMSGSRKLFRLFPCFQRRDGKGVMAIASVIFPAFGG